MNKNLVVKDNALINASYNLELVEQRLIMLSVVEARRTKQEIVSSEFLTIYADRYIDEFGVHRNVAYQALKDACRHLFERRFTYQKLTAKGNREIVTSRWVQSISYVENEAIVRLKFSDDVAPLIHNLEKNFTSYDLEQVAQLNSKYAVRLYEVVLAWHSTGKTPMIKIDELRERLGVLNDEYTELKNLKARVIDFAIKQINQKTNITLSYEQHKQGRKIIGFTFTIKQKPNTKQKKTKDDETRDFNTVDLLSPIKMTDKQRAIFASKLAYEPELEKYAQGDLNHYGRLAEWIKKDLLDPNRVNFYRPILERLGFIGG